jgi:hypothetical protein
MRRLTRSGIRTRLSGLLRVRKSRERHGEPGMRSVGRCLLLATTPLAVLLLTAAAAPADPAGTIATGAKRTSKTVGPSGGSRFTARNDAACSPRPNDGMAICANHDVAGSACKAGGVYKAAERPQANSRSTGANTRSGSAARAARDSGADVEPAGCRDFPGSGGNADASANAESTSDHRAGDCWYCGG